MDGKKAKSPAGAKLWSTIYVKGISPKDVECASDTIGITLSPTEAVELAAMLVSMAYDREAQGDIHVTGKKIDNSLTVIRRIEGRYPPLGRRAKRN